MNSNKKYDIPTWTGTCSSRRYRLSAFIYIMQEIVKIVKELVRQVLFALVGQFKHFHSSMWFFHYDSQIHKLFDSRPDGRLAHRKLIANLRIGWLALFFVHGIYELDYIQKFIRYFAK